VHVFVTTQTILLAAQIIVTSIGVGTAPLLMMEMQAHAQCVPVGPGACNSHKTLTPSGRSNNHFNG
jgi:hypothetical protein